MGNLMSKAKRYKPEEAPEKIGNQCQANGCPLIGTCSDSVHADSGFTRWYCHLHHEEPDAAKWGSITLGIKSNIGIYSWYVRLNKAAVAEFHMNRNLFIPHEAPNLSPTETESLIDYKARILKEFFNRAKQTQSGRYAT